MPTKDELIAFASDVGVDVSSSATKAEIEAALYDAGYDPVTMEATDVAEENMTAEDFDAAARNIEGTSSDAANSTYTRVDDPAPGTVPPPGHIVEQTRGEL